MSSPDLFEGDFIHRIPALSRTLRRAGAGTTLLQMLEAVRGLARINIGDRADFKTMLRATLISSPEEAALFDYYFELYFNPGFSKTPAAGSPDQAPGFRTPEKGPSEAFPDRDKGGRETAELAVGASLEKALSMMDLGELSPDETAEAERRIRRLSMKLATRLGNTVRRGAGPGDVHFPKTMRSSLQTGGEPVRLRFRKKRTRPWRPLILCDVSSSMKIYTRFFLIFMSCLSRTLGRTEAFIFSTRPARITRQLKQTPPGRLMDRLIREKAPFSGGTTIGECIREILEKRPYLLSRCTICLIMSDGWDRGDPAVLTQALSGIKNRAARIIWLNPLAADQNYEPLAGGIAAALPFLDLLAPFSRLKDVENLAERLAGRKWR